MEKVSKKCSYRIMSNFNLETNKDIRALTENQFVEWNRIWILCWKRNSDTEVSGFWCEECSIRDMTLSIFSSVFRMQCMQITNTSAYLTTCRTRKKLLSAHYYWVFAEHFRDFSALCGFHCNSPTKNSEKLFHGGILAVFLFRLQLFLKKHLCSRLLYPP